MTSAGLLGVWGKWMKHAKYIYNIQDFNPEQVLAVGYTKSKLVTDAMMWFDKFSCKRSDLVITVGRDLVETVENRFRGKKVPKTVMINNWIDENEIYPLDENNEKVFAFKKKYGLDGKFVIMYSGNIGLYYDLENLIKVVEKIKPGTKTADGREIVFAFVGAGSVLDKLVLYAKEHHMDNVVFIPYQDKADLIYSLNAGDAIHSAWKNGCKKLEFLGSSCIYPRMAPQPMKEDCLLTSELEKTNEAYALAKISGLKYCEFLNRQYGTDYISVMPTNLYKNVAIVYSPLNGTGLKPVTRTLKEMGYTNITVVKEQEQPDGNFPTCPYPNPEIKEAMALGMEYAKKCNADLLLATDPDCDRVGIAVKNKAGEYELLTGNQTGMLLLDYICSQRVKHGRMPADPVMVKTIVTMDMGEQIAAHYGLRTINVLTGFKFIGEQIGKLEQQGKADSYVFGFEESYGYLTGSYVRDKDGVDGAYMICEMFSYYATKGISLLDKLDELYKTYGYCLNTLHSYEFDGSAGFAKMQNIMQAFRGDIKEFGGKKVVKLLDYAPGLDGLPKSDVLKFLLEDNCSIVVRPSGTEPKLKTYISVSAENKAAAEKVEAEICKSAEKYLK